MKFLFIGAGAIGTYVGGSLADAGHQVTFVEQPAAAQVIGANGLSIVRHLKKGDARPERTSVRDVSVFTSQADALAAGPYDVAVCALKSFDTGGAIQTMIDTGAGLPPVLSLQNGVDNEPLIESLLGPGRVIAGTVTTAVAKPGVGQVIEEKRRGLGVSLEHPLGSDLVAALDGAGLRAQGYLRAGPMKWSKLLTNLQGNATSAILDMPVGALFADKATFGLEIAALRECLDVMAALGHHPVDLPGTPVRALAFAAQRLPSFIAQPALVRALGSGRGDKMPSFHIDLHSGRGQTEVRWLNGAVVRHGAEVGVPTPVNALLTQTLEALSAGTESLETFRHNPDALLSRL
jgi:2-dehydropantoate 2-reductase